MKIYILILTILGSLFLSQAFAKDVIELAILDFPPYEFQEKNKIDGITVRIVREIFKRMDQPISITLLPWSRALLYLKKGEIDGVFEILKKPEREDFVDYSKEVLIEERVSLFVLNGSPITFDGDLSKLNKYKFGVRQDFSYGSVFDQAVKDNKITNIVSKVYQDDILRMLYFGRLDILIGDKYGIPYKHKKSKIVKKPETITRLLPDLQVTPGFMAFSKKRHLSKIRDHFDVVLAEMKNDGTYNKILNDWDKQH